MGRIIKMVGRLIILIEQLVTGANRLSLQAVAFGVLFPPHHAKQELMSSITLPSTLRAQLLLKIRLT